MKVGIEIECSDCKELFQAPGFGGIFSKLHMMRLILFLLDSLVVELTSELGH
jgi:hypothetical protein